MWPQSSSKVICQNHFSTFVYGRFGWKFVWMLISLRYLFFNTIIHIWPEMSLLGYGEVLDLLTLLPPWLTYHCPCLYDILPYHHISKTRWYPNKAVIDNRNQCYYSNSHQPKVQHNKDFLNKQKSLKIFDFIWSLGLLWNILYWFNNDIHICLALKINDSNFFLFTEYENPTTICIISVP